MTTDQQPTAAQAARPRRVLWQTALAVLVMWRLGKIFTREGS